MTHRIVARLGLTVLTLALVLGALAAPAQAERWVKRDRVGDVARHDVDNPTPDDAGTPAPDHANADLVRTVVRYSRHRVKVVMRFRELDRSERHLIFGATVYYPLGDGGRVYFEAFVHAARGNWKGTVGYGGEEATPACAVRHRVDYAHNRVSISYPATCIGAPAWVRVHGLAVSTNRPSADVFFKDEMIESPDDSQRLSRRIHRG
jgi:hypothetical protein